MYAQQSSGTGVVQIESVGGVDAAKRVASGGALFDVVILASDAIDKLVAAGHLSAPASKVDLGALRRGRGGAGGCAGARPVEL